MLRKGIELSDSSVLILGITFKENCPDIRNTKIVDIVKNYENSTYVDCFDPWADPEEVKRSTELKCSSNLIQNNTRVIIAVSHIGFC